MELNRYQTEIQEAQEALKDLGKCVVVMCSSAIQSGTNAYEQAEATGYELAKAGYAVITGGGPGLMEAVNKGAQRAGGKSVGVCMKFTDIFIQNEYIDPQYNIVMTNMAARKQLFWNIATAFVALPGGFGTLDEITECMTLMQMNETRRRPLILQDRNYWLPLVTWIKQVMKNSYSTIKDDDLSFIHLTDSAKKSIAIIESVDWKA